jgi:hypothetical protein
MNEYLLAEFLAEDCDEHVRRLILKAIEEDKTNASNGSKNYSFNRFNLCLNFATREVVLDDDLNATANGEFRIDLDAFVAALAH